MRLILRMVALCAAVSISAWSHAQEEEVSPFEDAIETDRDSFTPSTDTAGFGRSILEAAYSFIDNRGVEETHSYPEVLLRYGVIEDIELRLGYNFEVGGAANDVSAGAASDEFATGELEREHSVSYGLKARLLSQAGLVPTHSMIVQGRKPFGGATNDSQITATYVFGWELAGGSLLDAAIRYGTGVEEEDHFNVWAPSVVLKTPIGERWDAHIEYFSLFSRDKSDEFVKQYVSPGLHYLVTPDLEIGTRLGWGLTDDSANFFVNTGLGWRF